MFIIAKSKKGSEFIYNPKTAHSVSKNSMNDICDILNSCKYQLKPDNSEVWFIYDIDCYDIAFDYAQFQKFTIRKGIVKDVHI